MDRYSPGALSDEEREQGLILACRARPLTDVRVQWLAKVDAVPMKRLDARVARIDRVAHDVVMLTVALAVLYLQIGFVSIHLYIASALGIWLTIMLMAALMGLVFLSSGTGHDSAVIDPLADELDV